jgi:hypothetical protein
MPEVPGPASVHEDRRREGAARQILERLDYPVDAPRLVRTRDPTTLDGDEPDAA